MSNNFNNQMMAMNAKCSMDMLKIQLMELGKDKKMGVHVMALVDTMDHVFTILVDPSVATQYAISNPEVTLEERTRMNNVHKKVSRENANAFGEIFSQMMAIKLQERLRSSDMLGDKLERMDVQPRATSPSMPRKGATSPSKSRKDETIPSHRRKGNTSPSNRRN
jgi:hypothetical protein